MVKKVGWLVVSLVAAVSFAGAVGAINPQEKVNALWLVTAAACFYAVIYRFYASFLAAREVLSPRAFAGAILILAGILTVELKPMRFLSHP